jgi:hypothetical protein
MFSKTMRPGEAVEIGDVAVVRVEYKSGSATKLSFFSQLPIRCLVDGLVPPRYVYGVVGPPRRVLEMVQRVG